MGEKSESITELEMVMTNPGYVGPTPFLDFWFECCVKPNHLKLPPTDRPLLYTIGDDEDGD